MNQPTPRAILFVCLGNICRSPLAEGVFRHVADANGFAGRLLIDSAGTGGWHIGSPPDPRSVEVAKRNGIDISGQTCREVTDADFARFDMILGMDCSNVDELVARAPDGAGDRVGLFMDVALGRAEEVPDPYYGGASGFDDVYRMILTASRALAGRL